MARTQTVVQLSEELVASLDAAASRQGLSRSALIRQLVADGLRRAGADGVGERIAEGYRRVPRVSRTHGGPERPDGPATEELLLRLDAEERAGGHDPW